MEVRGRMRIGAEDGIRPGKWSVIMDCFCFAFIRMRRVIERFAESSLLRRDVLENGPTDGLGPGDVIEIAGTGHRISDVDGPPLSSVGASGAEAGCVCFTSCVGGGGSGENVTLWVLMSCGRGVILEEGERDQERYCPWEE